MDAVLLSDVERRRGDMRRESYRISIEASCAVDVEFII